MDTMQMKTRRLGANRPCPAQPQWEWLLHYYQPINQCAREAANVASTAGTPGMQEQELQLAQNLCHNHKRRVAELPPSKHLQVVCT